ELGDPPESPLPDADLIHFYWALYWYDDTQQRPTDPYRLRKLSYHLLKTNVSTAGRCSLIGKYFDALLFAINGSLRSCIFRDLRNQIDKAFKPTIRWNLPVTDSRMAGLPPCAGTPTA